MDNARQILSTLGVNQDRILQESFGESKPSTESRPLEARTVETVVFLHSEKVCQVSAGSTLLDLAEQERGADSVWLPPGPMRYVRYASPERHRSNGRRSRVDG